MHPLALGERFPRSPSMFPSARLIARNQKRPSKRDGPGKGKVHPLPGRVLPPFPLPYSIVESRTWGFLWECACGPPRIGPRTTLADRPPNRALASIRLLRRNSRVLVSPHSQRISRLPALSHRESHQATSQRPRRGSTTRWRPPQRLSFASS